MSCQIKLTVDPEDKIQEEDEGNNTAVMVMPFCGVFPPQPDLRVNSLTPEKISLAGKDVYRITAECENAGNTTGNPTFGFWWYLNGEKYEYQGYLAMTSFGDFPAPLQKFNVVTTVPSINSRPARTRSPSASRSTAGPTSRKTIGTTTSKRLSCRNNQAY